MDYLASVFTPQTLWRNSTHGLHGTGGVFRWNIAVVLNKLVEELVFLYQHVPLTLDCIWI
jgi:hypothetical protein